MPKTAPRFINREELLKRVRETAEKVAPVKTARPLVVRTAAVYERMRDPALLRLYYHLQNRPLINSVHLEGASPPDIFVGRIGYPKVFVGPLLPPYGGDTSELGTPEAWIGKSMEEIVKMRTELVRGMATTHIKAVLSQSPGKIVDAMQELGLAKDSVTVDAEWARRPLWRIKWDDHVQPYGPSAPIRRIDLSGIKTDHKVEKAHSDTDLKAGQAMVLLYKKGVLVSKIQRSLSAGLFGLWKNRKFVPTRWSITATDDTIGKALLEKVKTLETIDEFRVYEFEGLDNRWEVLMMPRPWTYELMEAWWPGTIWNPERHIAMYSSYEGFFGRKTYAEIGGCYYAARLAVAEHLLSVGKQAAAVIFRESHPGYIMPVGVWNVREHVRAALRQEPLKFDGLQAALARVSSKLEIPMHDWLMNSGVMRQEFRQRRLTDFIRS